MENKKTRKYNAAAAVIGATLLALLLCACPSPGTFYTLAAGADPETGGTVTAVPASENYLEGTMVMVSAEPAPGYAFSGWEGDAEGSYGVAAVYMDGEKTVTAKFTALPPETYSLTVNVLPPGSGTVSRSAAGPAYASGSTVTLTAHPSAGYVFSSWSGGTTGGTNPKAVTMDGNKTITANFTSQNPGGSIQGSPLSLSGAVLTLAGAPGVYNQHYDGVGVGALFYSPHSSLVIGSYLYVADRSNHRIRRVNTATGAAETFSGSGTSGNVDGAAEAAQFNSPSGITTDGTYLYVTCSGSHTVRRVSLSDGSVETIAGTSGSAGSADNASGLSASFNYPIGIVHVSGSPASLYLCDSNNSTIRKITLTGSNEVSTLAGTAGSTGGTDGTGAAARFHYPAGIATDGTSLWIADSYAYTIREVTIATALVVTRAGVYNSYGFTDAAGTSARFYYPNDLVLSGSTLYIADTGNNAVRTMNTVNYSVTTLTGTAGNGYADGGPTQAKFNNPAGLALSGTSLYVCDTGNHMIRRVNTGTASTVSLAGSPQKSGFWNGTGVGALYTNPRGATTDGTYVYTTDGYHTVRRVNPATGEVLTLSGSPNSTGTTDGIGASARFNGPEGVTAAGNYLYVCDSYNYTIRRIDKATGETSTFAGAAGVNGSQDGTGEDARFGSPQGITNDGANLYVTDNHTVRKIEIATRVVTTIAGTSGVTGTTDSRNGLEARFNNPHGITSDGSFLYICDLSNNAIRVVEIATAEVSTLAGYKRQSGFADGTGISARFRSPAYITCDGTYLYVTDLSSHTVRRVGIASREVTTLAGLDNTAGWADGTGNAARFNEPRGITNDGTRLYICDYSNHVIRTLD